MKCEKCGNETKANFGASQEILCKNCAGKEETKIKNSKASLLSFFSGIFIIIGFLLALYAFFVERNVFLSIYYFLAGLFIMAILDGFAEIIKQLTSLNSSLKEKKLTT